MPPVEMRCDFICGKCHHPANRRHRPDVGTMFGQRRRQWPNIGPTLAQCLVFAGICSHPVQSIITLKCHMIYVIASQDQTTPEIITLPDWKKILLSWLPPSDILHVSKINAILIFTTLLHKYFLNRFIVHYISYVGWLVSHARLPCMYNKIT